MVKIAHLQVTGILVLQYFEVIFETNLHIRCHLFVDCQLQNICHHHTVVMTRQQFVHVIHSTRFAPIWFFIVKAKWDALYLLSLHRVNWSFTKHQFVNYGMKTRYWLIRGTCHFVAICITVLRERAANIRHRPVEASVLRCQTSWMFASESRWKTSFRLPVSWCWLLSAILFKLVSSWQYHARVCAASIN